MSAAQKSDLSVVGYWINSDPASRNFGQLERLGKGLTWEGQPSAGGLAFLTNATGPVDLSGAPGSLSAYPGSNGTPSIGTETGKFADGVDGDFHLLGDGVYRMEYGFLLKPFTDTGGVFPPARYSRGLEFTDDLFGSGIRSPLILNSDDCLSLLNSCSGNNVRQRSSGFGGQVGTRTQFRLPRMQAGEGTLMVCQSLLGSHLLGLRVSALLSLTFDLHARVFLNLHIDVSA